MICYLRYMRRTQLWSRTTVSGFVTKAEPVTTTCIRSTETQPWMVLLSTCTMKWRLATGLGPHASKSSRQLQFLMSFARGKAQNNSTARTLSSRWCSGRLDLQPGSSKQLTRLQSPTCSCKSTTIIPHCSRAAKFCLPNIFELLWFVVILW